MPFPAAAPVRDHQHGRLLQQQIQLTEAARIGALNGTTADVQAEVTSVVGSGVTVTYPSAPVTCTASSAVGAIVPVTVTVTVTV